MLEATIPHCFVGQRHLNLQVVKQNNTLLYPLPLQMVKGPQLARG
jgi:hypothetical protein